MHKRGFTFVELMIVLAIVAIIAAFSTPSVMRSRMCANEAAAVGALRALISAQATYISQHGVYGTLNQLLAEDLVGRPVIGGPDAPYVVVEIQANADYAYCFAAVPTQDGVTASKEYCVTQKGVIYEADFDTSTIGVSSGALWVPGKSHMPPFFTTTPETQAGLWRPIDE